MAIFRFPGSAASAVLVVLLSFGFAAACVQDEAVWETRLRFIEQDPQEIFPGKSMFVSDEVLVWQPEDQCLKIWPSDQRRLEIDFGGEEASLRWDRDRVSLFVDAALDTDSIDRIEVLVRSLTTHTRTGRMMLMWAEGDERFSRERSVNEPTGELVEPASRRYRVFPGIHPKWQGTVTKLRLVLIPPLGAEVELCGVRGFDEMLNLDGLAASTVSGFKVAIGRQIRNAFPALPGRPIERELVVPPKAELRFAYGLQAGVRIPVRLRVTAVADGRASELFATSLDPEEDGGSWREGRVDLAPLAGKRIKLRLETSADGDLGGERGLPLWGHPEVVAPRQ